MKASVIRASGALLLVVPLFLFGLGADPPPGIGVEGANAYKMGGGAVPVGYAGSDTCAACHADTAQNFGLTAHGRAGAALWKDAADCESCHGPGQAHVDSGGEEGMVSPAAMDPRMANEACLECHEGGAGRYWKGSIHEALSVACTSCHKVHSPWTNDKLLVNRNRNELCLSCHGPIRKHLHQRSHHPMKEGHIACSDCHSPHGSTAEVAISALSVNDKCYECHMEKRGPFLWEHIPVRENCLVCHNPHGSNQTNLLVKSAPRLCQSCHLLGHHQTVAGTPKQTLNVNRSCLNCHLAIHGSNHPSGIVLLR